ncbi:MAG: DUF4340 domain-containing protein [Lachnospiraceae bacterium]|nr:DUF4340 domain-containing protein [Lachnospiraceae bacterium]
MKKKGLPLVIALVCLLVLCVGYVCLVRYNDKQEKADSADKINVLNLKADDVGKLAYEIDGEKVSFTKDGDGWTLDSDAAFEVDADKVDSLISSITSMTATRKMEDISDLSEYGLDAPSQTVTLTDADGNETTICWGSNNATTGDDYVYCTEDDKTVYTVASSVQSSLSSSVEDYRATEETTTEEVTEEQTAEDTTETAE